MKLIGMEKIKDGKYLKNYQLTYLNKAGKEKQYEIVSYSELGGPEELGRNVNGLSIAAFYEDKLLLLKEFRMGVNRYIYNLCAGMLEQGETIEECMNRELYEETGLHVSRVIDILPPGFAAVAVSDIKTRVAFVEAEGEFSDHSSSNEEIKAAFYSREEVKELLQKEEFSTRAQLIAYFFSEGLLPGKEKAE